MSVLDEIIDGVRADLAERQARVSLDELKERVAKAPAAKDGAAALRGDGVQVDVRSRSNGGACHGEFDGCREAVVVPVERLR